MDPRIIDILRHTAVGVVLLIVVMFGMKHFRRFEAKKEIVAELQSATSDASFYRQFEKADAEATLLRCVAWIEQARSLGLTTSDLFDRVFEHKKPGDYDFGGSSSGGYTTREKLVRDTLETAHAAARQLDMLGPSPLRDLREGRLPHLPAGTPVIGTLIDPEISPGLEKIIPNLELRPGSGADPKRQPTAIEIAAARRLARDLADAGLIEENVAKLILDHYQTAATAGSEE